MVLRRGFFHWLPLSAIVLPGWLLLGWAIFNPSGWALLWTLFLAAPAVFLAQLVLSFMVRGRPTVRSERAVSWTDAGLFGLWHVMLIALGCYPSWFPLVLVLSIAMVPVLFWVSIVQFFGDLKNAGARILNPENASDPGFPADSAPSSAPRADGDMIVIAEKPHD